MASSRDSDEMLIARCLEGDYTSWDKLILRQQSLVIGIARAMGLSEQDREDVFQNVCISLYRNLGALRDSGRLIPWLSAMTRQEVYRFWRRRKLLSLDAIPEEALHHVEETLDARDRYESPEEAAMAVVDQHLVREGLADLPEKCRKLLVLLYGEPPHSYTEVVEQLKMPIGSIGPNRARCLQRLKKILEKRWDI